jgi:hypothetical protein
MQELLNDNRMVRYYYENNILFDSYGNAIMMGWEKPVMKKVADLICENGGKILNIGFGMGIVDTFISERQPDYHVIIENHPDVQKYMIEKGWDKKDNTKVYFNSWQNVLDEIGTFDGIYLDTWCDARFGNTTKLLNKNLKVGGIFSMWYNKNEFDKISSELGENYEITFEYLKNENLIPHQQHKNGKFYIQPSDEFITIPLIKKVS